MPDKISIEKDYDEEICSEADDLEYLIEEADELPCPLEGGPSHCVRTQLARKRNMLSRIRTIQAAERTYLSWVRTGFAMASAGWTLGQLLSTTNRNIFALILGGSLIFLGIICFIYGWIFFRNTYFYIYDKKISLDSGDDYKDRQLLRFNMATATVLTVALTLIFISAYGYLIYNQIIAGTL